MTGYKCFECSKDVKFEYAKKKVRCPYCGSKVLFKTRSLPTTVKAV